MMYQCLMYDGHGHMPCYYVLDMEPGFYGDTYEEIIGNPEFHQHVDECIRKLYPNLCHTKNLSKFKEYVFLIPDNSIKNIVIGL